MATVEERIAHLQEELNLTAAFTGAMVRMGNYRAALGVIDEQRDRVHEMPSVFDRAFARPRRKVKAAVVGLAAAALLGSGALAAFRAPRTEAAPAVQRLERAVDLIHKAVQQSGNAAAATAYVKQATTELALIDPKHLPANDDGMPKIDDALKLLQEMDGVSQLLISQALEVAKKAGIDAPPAPQKPKNEPDPKAGQSPAPPPQETPPL